MSNLLKDEASIRQWLGDYNVNNYSLKKDSNYGYVVDVDGDVDLSYCKLDKILVKFKHVSGAFYCHYNNLTSLEGSPELVGDCFDCKSNSIVSLRFSPSKVGTNFDCSNNKIGSLQYCPKVVNDDFDCRFNNIATLEYIPDTVEAEFHCDKNPLLGDYQRIIDFKELKDRLTSDKEKALLLTSIHQGGIRKVLKI